MENELLKLHKSYLDALLSGKIPALPETPGEGAPAGGALPSGGAPAAHDTSPAPGGALPSGTSPAPGGLDGEDAKLLAEYGKGFVTLISQIAEIRNFMQALCQGDLNAKVPGRRNYIAAPLKELHTQLSSLTWGMEQLSKGNVVGRLYYRGVLFESFNSLIEKIAALSNHVDASNKAGDATWDWSVNSWRYHQILSALNNLRIMVIEVAQDGRIVYANRPAKEYFGEIEPMPNKPEGAVPLTNELGRYLAQICGESEKTDFPKFGEIYDEQNNCWYKITSDKVHFSETRSGYLHMIDNISEWKRHESNLKKSASIDPLTGIYNRRYGLQALEEAIQAAKSGIASCAAFIDLDNLKSINDKFGHNSGDDAIKTIAQTLSSSIRDKKDVVSRFGGDEFVIIFKNCKEQSAKMAIGRMLDKLDTINGENAVGYRLGFSHGIVEIGGDNTAGLQGVIEQMDRLMYKNKTAKKQAAMLSNEAGMPNSGTK